MVIRRGNGKAALNQWLPMVAMLIPWLAEYMERGFSALVEDLKGITFDSVKERVEDIGVAIGIFAVVPSVIQYVPRQFRVVVKAVLYYVASERIVSMVRGGSGSGMVSAPKKTGYIPAKEKKNLGGF